ncbi:hypothetical protein OAU50_05445 [Planctomycetota bacterium]|nr:hypothetical protein [Planctomycetota bacterium]
MKSIATLILLLFASHASACLWDNDTLYEEEQGVEDIRDVIVGNFVRNPPKYYEIRLERVSKLLETDQDNLELYDDASVACDRLHRANEAIAWQEKKLMAMDRLAYDPKQHAQPNHRYRYLANLGTHYIHRWLFNVDKWKDLSDVTTARELIQAAIDENPDAHFGREVYQLLMIEWFLRNRKERRQHPGHIVIVQDDDIAAKFIKKDPHAAADGFAGLMRLGSGWSSVDLHAALAFALSWDEERSNVAYLAVARVLELYDDGAKHLIGDDRHGVSGIDEFGAKQLAMLLKVHRMPRYETKTLGHYASYRSVSNEWHNARLTFMLKKFQSGLHPDTHSAFWDDFSQNHSKTELPSSEPSFMEKVSRWWNDYGLALSALAAPLVVIMGGVFILVLRRRRKRMAIA